MTESQFRKKMLENGWSEEEIQDYIDTYNEDRMSGINPIPYEDTIERLGEIDRYPCE